MTSWTTIPPWLYRNDLPDDELQQRYVEVAEHKWRACAADREALEAEILELRAQKRGELTAEAWSALRDDLAERYEWWAEAYRVERAAWEFLEETRRALAAYRRRRRPLGD